jgi:hypothetical protein
VLTAARSRQGTRQREHACAADSVRFLPRLRGRAREGACNKIEADKRSSQFVLGTGGTLLAGKIKGNLSGEKIAGTTNSYGRSEHRFGFAMFKPAPQGSTATCHDAAGKSLFRCKLGSGEVACN